MNEELILDIKLDEGDSEKQLVDLNQLIAEQKQRVLDLTDAIKELSKSDKASSDQIAAVVKQRDTLSNSVKQNTTNQKNLLTVINSEKGSVESLLAQNKILTAQRNSLGDATDSQRAKVQQLNAAIEANTARVKNQSTEQEKQKMNIGNYIKTVEVGGYSLDSIASKFASPYLAAGAALGGLFKLYAQSKQGAQDLELAQTKLNAIFQTFADTIGKVGTDSSGKGVFSKLVDGVLLASGAFGAYAISLAAEIKQQADKEAQLMELRRQRFAKVYDEQAEQQQRIRDDEQKTLKVRINAAEVVLANVRAANKLIISTSQEQLEAKNKLLQKDKQNLDLQIEVARAEAQVADIQEKNTKRESQALEALLKLQEQQRKGAATKPYQSQPIPSGITNFDKNVKALDKIYKDQQLADKKNYLESAQTQSEFQTTQFNSYIRYLKQKKKAAEAYGEDTLEIDQQIADAQIAEAERTANVIVKTNKVKTTSNIQQLQTWDNLLGTSLAVFDKNTAAFQIAAISKALIDTYLAANNALATGGPFAMLGALALGLANVAAIEGVAMAGGGDFYTTKPTLLLVGDNPGGVERVTVEPISGKGQTKKFNPGKGLPNGVAMAGGGMLQVNRQAESTSLMRNLNQAVRQTQVVMVLQDFEVASTKKNQPINRAKVLTQ